MTNPGIKTRKGKGVIPIRYLDDRLPIAKPELWEPGKKFKGKMLKHAKREKQRLDKIKGA